MNNTKRQLDMTKEELEFAIFCIENIALKLKLTGNEVYDILTGEDDLLDTYIIPEYDILHTQGKEYIIEDILSLMEKRG
ncbi:MAG: DUF3791 domain-containing protein [Emergencia sp.]|nr:DUF3791 domain-containing protein [Emergencia sp.]